MKRNLHAGGTRSRGLSVNVFTESELEDIHLASLEVLERTGVFVEADDARDIFRDGGCTVDAETRMVRIPPHVVEDAIASSPSKYVLCGRDPKNDFLMEPGRVAFTNFSEGIAVVDSGHRQGPRVHAAGRRRHRPPQRLPQRDGHARDLRGGQGRPAGDRRRPQHRGAAAQHHQAHRHRATLGHGVPRDPAHVRRGRRRRGRAARAAHRVRGRLPGQPAQAPARTPPRSSSSARAGGSRTTS